MTLRPWNLTEVPLGTSVRFKAGEGPWRGKVESVNPLFVIQVQDCPCHFRPEEALEMLEYFDGKEWKPCGRNS
jgi:hypothetical protein